MEKPARDLVLVDDVVSRTLTRHYGEGAGWNCDEAENGAVALERISQNRPDLILLDLMMPVMDGFEMLDELRSTMEYRTIPVLVLTAKSLTDEDRRRLSGHVERIVEKGHHSSEDVLTYVRDVLNPSADPRG